MKFPTLHHWIHGILHVAGILIPDRPTNVSELFVHKTVEGTSGLLY